LWADVLVLGATGADQPLMASMVRSDSTTPDADAGVGVVVSVCSLVGSGVLQTAQTDVPGGLVRPHCGHSMECPDAI